LRVKEGHGGDVEKSMEGTLMKSVNPDPELDRGGSEEQM